MEEEFQRGEDAQNEQVEQPKSGEREVFSFKIQMIDIGQGIQRG